MSFTIWRMPFGSNSPPETLPGQRFLGESRQESVVKTQEIRRRPAQSFAERSAGLQYASVTTDTRTVQTLADSLKIKECGFAQDVHREDRTLLSGGIPVRSQQVLGLAMMAGLVVSGTSSEAGSIPLRSEDVDRASPEHLSLGELLKLQSDHVLLPANAPVRAAQLNEAISEWLEHYRDAHPKQFAHDHPFYNRLLSDPSFMNQIIDRWERDERRFEYWHPLLWRVLAGYQNLAPPPVIVPPPTVTSSGSPPPVTGHSGSPGPGGQSVSPEPSSYVLLLSGIGVALVVVGPPRSCATDLEPV